MSISKEIYAVPRITYYIYINMLGTAKNTSPAKPRTLQKIIGMQHKFFGILAFLQKSVVPQESTSYQE